MDFDADFEDDLDELLILYLYQRNLLTNPETNSIRTGNQLLGELIEGNPASFQNMARMDKETFSALCEFLMSHAGLRHSAARFNAREELVAISAQEKLMIYLYILSGM